MESVSEPAFGINVMVMKILGLYFEEKTSFVNKIRAYFMYFVLTFPLPILGTLYILIKDTSNIDISAFSISQFTCQIIKLLPLLIKRDKVRKCIRYFDAPSFKVVKKRHKEIMDECIQICQRNTRVLLISIFIASVGWSTTPLFAKGQDLPIDVWLPFNLMDNSEIRFITYIFLVLEVEYGCNACAAVDPLIGGLAYLAASQFRILKDNLKHLSEYADEEMSEQNHEKAMEKSQIIQDIIRSCIIQHNEILKFVKEYEDCFSWGVFSQFFGSILVICFCCLQLSKSSAFSYNFVSIVICLACFLGQIYLYSHYGTILFEESNSLTNAIYMGKWYDYDEKAKSTLMVMMEYSKKPVVITAGKILDVSVETFTIILRRSYSLLAVLKNY